MKDVFHRRQARVLLFLTFLLYGVIIVQYHFFVLAFEPVSFGVSAMCTANLLFTKSVILPISFSDLGVRESTAIFFFSRAGISAASAFNASICVFFVNIFFPSLLGSLMIFRIKSSKRKYARDGSSVFCMVVIVVLGALYVAQILSFIRGLSRLKCASGHLEYSVAVIVAARDEELHIERCVRSLLEQDYPHGKYTITVVDDQSSDRTAEIVRGLRERKLVGRIDAAAWTSPRHIPDRVHDE